MECVLNSFELRRIQFNQDTYSKYLRNKSLYLKKKTRQRKLKKRTFLIRTSILLKTTVSLTVKLTKSTKMRFKNTQQFRSLKKNLKFCGTTTRLKSI